MKIIRLLILLLLFSITANAQRVYVIYTNGVPANCINGNLYVDKTTGNIYSWKLGVGCIISGNVNGVSGSGVSGRISYWNGVSSLTSITGFTFDGLNLSIPIGGQFRTNGTAFNFSNLAGNINISQMNSGTGASSTTFWRGDGTWAGIGGVNPTNGFIPYNNAGVFADSNLVQGTNILRLLNLANANRFEIYNTTDSNISPVNYEHLAFYFNSNIAHIATQKGGTGIARALQLDYGGTTTAGITIPITSGPINFGGVVNATTGFQIGGAATNANVLRGNGTNFISQALIPTDVGISFAQVTGSNFTTTSLTLVDITGLTIPLTTNATYYLTCNINGNGADASGVAFGVNYSAAGAAVELGILADVAGTGVRSRRINTLASATAQSFWTSATDVSTSIKGRVTTGANAGNLTIQIQKGTSGTATVYIGSMCMAVRVS